MDTVTLTLFDFRRIASDLPTSDGDPILRDAFVSWYLRRELRSDADLIAWSRWRFSQKISKSSDHGRVDYASHICTTDYHDPMQVDYLTTLLELPDAAPVTLGRYCDTAYRLKPNPAALRPTTKSVEELDCSLLPYMYLGINRDIRSTSSGPNVRLNRGTQAGVDTESARKDSAVESIASNDDTGFVFFQLGTLEYADFRQTAGIPSSSALWNLCWQPSEYVVVVKISDVGRSEDVYFIREQIPDSEALQKRFAIYHRVYGADLIGDKLETSWPGKRVPVVRIAHSFECLGMNTILNGGECKDEFTNTCYLLCSAVWDRDRDRKRIVRQYVTMSYPELEESKALPKKSPAAEMEGEENTLERKRRHMAEEHRTSEPLNEPNLTKQDAVDMDMQDEEPDADGESVSSEEMKQHWATS